MRSDFRPSARTLVTLLAVITAGCNDDSSSMVADPDANTALATLTLTGGELDQVFDPDLDAYTATVGYFVTSVGIAVTTTDPDASVRIGSMYRRRRNSGSGKQSR
jgi:hypothetical protein